MPNPLAIDRTRKTLAELEAPIARAIAAARTRDIDEQQVAVARLCRPRDQAARRAGPGGLRRDRRRALPGAGSGVRRHVASEIGRLMRDFGAEHGLSSADLPSEETQAFAREALAEERVRAIGRAVAQARGPQRLPARRDAGAGARRRARRSPRARSRRTPSASTATTSWCPRRSSSKMAELGYFGLVGPRAVRRRRDGQRRHDASPPRSCRAARSRPRAR